MNRNTLLCLMLLLPQSALAAPLMRRHVRVHCRKVSHNACSSGLRQTWRADRTRKALTVWPRLALPVYAAPLPPVEG